MVGAHSCEIDAFIRREKRTIFSIRRVTGDVIRWLFQHGIINYNEKRNTKHRVMLLFIKIFGLTVNTKKSSHPKFNDTIKTDDLHYSRFDFFCPYFIEPQSNINHSITPKIAIYFFFSKTNKPHATCFMYMR